jgi:hypothetical protein
LAYVVPVEQAALNALIAWLRAGLPDPSTSADGITVLNNWPSADFGLTARAVSLIFAGERQDTLTERVVDSYTDIHVTLSPRVSTPAEVDAATAYASLNASKVSYEAHRISTTAHAAADTTNAVTAPNAIDQDTAYALAVDLQTQINAHELLLTSHPAADTENTVPAIVNTPTGTINAAIAIRRALDAHYAARLYTWRIRGCEQPVQLDVWAIYQDSREDIVARLEPLLNADPSRSAGFTTDDGPRNGTIIALGDGFSGYADFLFDKPLRTNTSDGQQRDEYRATYAGTAEFWLTVRAQHPRTARMRLTATVDSAAAATATVSSSATDESTATILI